MKKILVVDDDESCVTLIQHLLNDYGFKVTHHLTGIGLSSVINKQKPDLVLLDIRLPGKSGIQVCKELKKTYKIPVVLFSSKNELNRKEAKNSKADGFIEKPFDIKELIGTIGLNVISN